MESLSPKASSCDLQSFWSDFADAQADLKLLWVHIWSNENWCATTDMECNVFSRKKRIMNEMNDPLLDYLKYKFLTAKMIRIELKHEGKKGNTLCTILRWFNTRLCTVLYILINIFQSGLQYSCYIRAIVSVTCIYIIFQN